MSSEVETLRKDAHGLLRQGQRLAALPLLEKLLEATPDDLTLLQYVADLSAQLGRKAEAVSLYARACEAYARRGYSMHAMALCRCLIALDPTHARTQELLATLFADQPGVEPGDEAPVVPPAPGPPPLEFTQFRREGPGASPSTQPSLEGLADATVVPAPPPLRLPRIPLFSSLSPSEFIDVLQGAVTARAYDGGELVVREGDADDAMFAVVQGSAVVERSHHGKISTLDTFHEGDFFGEVALLAQTRRTVSVRAAQPLVTLRFERSAMQRAMAHSPAVARTVDVFCRARLLANWLRASPLFRGLNATERAELRQRFEPMTAKAGQVLIHAGAPGEAVYLLVRGRCSVEGVHFEQYPELVEGDSFGEISVIRGGSATATVTALGDCLLLRLPKAGALTSALQHPAVRPLVDRIIEERLYRTDQLLEWRDGR